MRFLLAGSTPMTAWITGSSPAMTTLGSGSLRALQVDAAAAELHDRLDEARRAGDRVGLVARGEAARAIVDLAHPLAVGVEPVGFARTQQCRVDQVPLGDPLASTAQHQPLPGDHLALPQALVLWSQKIEPFGGAMGRR